VQYSMQFGGQSLAGLGHCRWFANMSVDGDLGIDANPLECL